MNFKIKEGVQHIIKDAKAFYRQNPLRLRADYRAEKEFNKDYNGRQLLELIQNCDDQEATEICLTLDTERKIFSISNDGIPFSLKGYESLTIAHLSPKISKKRFIGNKGLGFRSLINWSSEIDVISNGFCVRFSNEQKRRHFEELYAVEKRQELLQELGVKEHVVPIPMLAIPELVQDNFGNNYTTTVSLKYYERFTNDIAEQINDIGANTLIFLNNISRIIIVVDGKRVVFECERLTLNSNPKEFGPVEQIIVGSESWDIYKTEGLLPDYHENESVERNYYEIKLALTKDLNQTETYLFSYLKTNIKTGLPFLLHATCDLTLDRNSFAVSVKNKTVINEAVKFIIKTALSLTQQKVGWKPLKMLLEGLKNKNGTLEKLNFYQAIIAAIESEPVYPCVDGKYRSKSEVRYWSCEFSKLILQQGWEDVIPYAVIPADGTVNVSELGLDSEIENIEYLADVLTKRVVNLQVRAKLIVEFCREYSGDFSTLFLNQENGFINQGQTVYTPSKKGFKIPDHCTFTILHSGLLDELRSIFGTSDNPLSEEALIEKLSDIIKIKIFNKQNIVGEIIRQTNDCLDSHEADSLQIKRFVLDQIICLYEMEGISSIKDQDVHVVNQLGEIVKASGLFLSEQYDSGKVAIQILGHIYEPKEYLASPEELGLTANAPVKVEEFVLSLGVNRHVIVFSITERLSYTQTIYSEYFEKYKSELNHVQYSNREVEAEVVLGLEKILSLEEEKLLALLLFDKLNGGVIWKAINSKSKLCYKTQNLYPYKIPATRSLLKELFQQKIFGCNEFLLDPPQRLYNERNPDYKHLVFEQFKTSRTEINQVMLDLGAVEEFSELSLKRVLELIKKYHIKSDGIKYIHSLYKKVLVHLKNNNKTLRNTQLLAQKGDYPELMSNSQIYYSQQRSIPKSLWVKYPVLYLPRDRNTELVVECFGVQSLDGLLFELTNSVEALSKQKEFNVEWNIKKPYLLCARIKDTDSEERQKYFANKLNKLEIRLCHKVSFEVDGYEGCITDYEYIVIPASGYLVKVPESLTGSDLFNETRFTDVIAEILGLELDVRVVDEFKLRLREYEPDLQHSKLKYGNELFELSQKLLGGSTPDWLFWRPIIMLKGLEEEYTDSASLVKEKLSEELGIPLELALIDCDKAFEGKEIEKITELFSALNLTLRAYNEIAAKTLDYSRINKARIVQYLKEYLSNYEYAIHKYLNSLGPKDKMKYLDNRAAYRNGIVEYASKEASSFDDFIFPLNTTLLYNYINFLNITCPGAHEPFQEVDLELNSTKMLEKVASILTEKEIRLIKDTPALLSLTFFKGTLSFIKAELSKIKSEESVSSANTTEDAEVITHKNARFSSANNAIKPSRKALKVADTEKKKEKGNKAEQLSVLALTRLYGKSNVKHISKYDDSAGYDIEYRKGKGNPWRMLDIKAASAKGIYISRNELETAKDEPTLYDIGIFFIKEKRLEIFESVFINIKTEDLTPTEYLVNLSAIDSETIT